MSDENENVKPDGPQPGLSQFHTVHETNATTKGLRHVSPDADGHGWKCGRCNAVFPILRAGEPTEIATGYAHTDDGTLRCYPCCGEVDKQYMSAPGCTAITLYLVRTPNTKTVGSSNEKTELTNWPGTFRIPCRATVGTQIGRAAMTTVMCEFAGRKWRGTLDEKDVQCVTMRPLKPRKYFGNATQK